MSCDRLLRQAVPPAGAAQSPYACQALARWYRSLAERHGPQTVLHGLLAPGTLVWAAPRLTSRAPVWLPAVIVAYNEVTRCYGVIIAEAAGPRHAFLHHSRLTRRSPGQTVPPGA